MQMENIKYIYKCNHCKSTNILFDAYAEWSIVDQQFELYNTFDSAYCTNCDGECKPIKELINKEDDKTTNT